MNTIGLSLLLKMGCVCTRETININGIKYTVRERLGEGFVIFDISAITAVDMLLPF